MTCRTVQTNITEESRIFLFWCGVELSYVGFEYQIIRTAPAGFAIAVDVECHAIIMN